MKRAQPSTIRSRSKVNSFSCSTALQNIATKEESRFLKVVEGSYKTCGALDSVYREQGGIILYHAATRESMQFQWINCG